MCLSQVSPFPQKCERKSSGTSFFTNYSVVKLLTWDMEELSSMPYSAQGDKTLHLPSVCHSHKAIGYVGVGLSQPLFFKNCSTLT